MQIQSMQSSRWMKTEIIAAVEAAGYGASVKGVEGHFVPPSPEKTGITVPLTPSVASWSFAWDEFETLQGDV